MTAEEAFTHLDQVARLVREVIDLRAERDRLVNEQAAFHAECDKVGIPYDPVGLVRHHRGNAGLAAANWQLVAESQRDRLARQVEAVKAVLAEWESAHCNLRQYIQLRNALATEGPEQ